MAKDKEVTDSIIEEEDEQHEQTKEDYPNVIEEVIPNPMRENLLDQNKLGQLMQIKDDRGTWQKLYENFWMRQFVFFVVLGMIYYSYRKYGGNENTELKDPFGYNINTFEWLNKT